MNIQKYGWAVATLLLLIGIGCNELDNFQSIIEPDDFTEDEIRLSGNKAHILTRSGEKRDYFNANTLFRLFAVVSGQEKAGWTNTANHIENVYDVITSATSQYGGMNFRTINQGRTGKYNGRTIDVYGVTWDKVANPSPDPDGNFLPEALEGAPRSYSNDATTGGPLIDVEFDEATGSLPDLMWGVKRGCAPGQARFIDLPFEHTAFKITFKTVCNELTIDASIPGADKHVKLHKVTLLGDHIWGSAKLDVSTGKYSSHANPITAGRVFFNADVPGTSIEVGIDAPVQQIPGEMLLFPVNTSPESPLQIKVDFTMPGEVSPTSVIYPIENIDFQPNYEYSFTLTFMDDNMHLVIFSPQVYEWNYIPLDMGGGGDGEETLGKIVTFGGVTWMDRNLGAKASDPRIDWDGARGAYYQFARNIPYYFDQEAWDAEVARVGIANADNYGRPQLAHNSKRKINGVNAGYFYTFDASGNKVYQSKDYDNTCTVANLAINPGEPKSYAFICANTGNANGFWLGKNNVDNRDYDTYWQNTDTQPCPKGWKMPTAADYRSFLPYTSFNPNGNLGLVNAARSERDHGPSWTASRYICQINDGDNTYGYEDRVMGKINIYNEEGELVPKLYIMKNPGTDESYIIRICLRTATDKNGNSQTNTGTKDPFNNTLPSSKQYYEIFRYAVDNTRNTFRNSNNQPLTENEFKERFNAAFWKTPVEKMYFGIYGQIGETGNRGLILDGVAAFMKTSTPAADNGTSSIAYMRSDHDGIGVKSKTSKSPGQQIRCIKDLDAY